MLILRPMPGSMSGDSSEETLEPSLNVTDFGAWFSGLLAYTPAAYSKIDEYLKQVILAQIWNYKPVRRHKSRHGGTDARSLIVQFSDDQQSVNIPFAELSDGEKCFMICALVLAW